MIRTSRFGYVDDYKAIRISRRFQIDRAIVWNLRQHSARNGSQRSRKVPPAEWTCANVWNCENRLIEVEYTDSSITEYRYNGDGVWVSQDDGVVETLFVYDGNNLVQETDDTGLV